LRELNSDVKIHLAWQKPNQELNQKPRQEKDKKL
jgi:hypothetical protein